MTGLAGAIRNARVYDLSPLIRSGMPVFPGHPFVAVDRDARTHRQHGYFSQTVSFGEHTGSHVDAPAHALPSRGAATIETFPIARFVTPYAILDLGPLALAPGELASARDLEEAAERASIELERGDAALLHFGWDVHYDDPGGWWASNTPGLADDACRLLVDLGVGLVGSDTPTCDTAVVDGVIVAAHGHEKYFLPNDILIVEGLVGLATVPRRGIFVGAPLRIEGGSGAPIRALVIAEDDA